MKLPINCCLVTTIVISAFLLMPEPVSAQSKKGFDLKGFLTRLDKDGNGVVDPGEVTDDRTRSFLSKSGLDTSQGISIKGATSKVEKQRKERASGGTKSNSSMVPGFTVSEGKEESTPGFGVTEAERMPAEKAAASKYSDNSKRQTDRTLATYDRNKNGSLDPDEMRRIRWGDPKPSESDLNKDGVLSRGELLARYQARESGSSSRRSRSSSRDRSSRDRSSRDSSNRDRSDSKSSSRDRSSSRDSNDSSKSSSTKKSSSSSRSVSDSYKKYVDGLYKTYDKDGDGRLSEDEVSKMRRKPAEADGDSDGFISKEELIDWYSKKNSKRTSTSSSSSSSKSSSRSKRSKSYGKSSSSKSKGSLSSMDANQNGQIEMSEFSDEWDDEIVEEFYKKDTNRDGIISASEWSK